MKRTFILFFLTLGSFSITAQDFQGKAYYKSKITMDFGSWGDKMSSERKKMIKERMRPYLEPTFILTFDKEKSIYKEQERLDAPGSGGRSGWGKMMSGNGGPIFKNLKTKKFIQDSEFMGKKFLITDSVNKFNWVLEKEQKMIGNYLCFKATAEIPKKKTISSEWRKLEKSDSTDIQNEYTKVNAWYSPQIPIANGPAEFDGLPGLILELNYEKTVILCTKVVMNPEKKIQINEPRKGEVVSKNEYDKIVEDKVKEMREMYRGPRSKR